MPGTGDSEDWEGSAHCLKLDPSEINRMVNRLYTPEPLMSRTNQERQRKIEEAMSVYSPYNDPHLQGFWHRQQRKKRRAPQRTPPRGALVLQDTTSTPSENQRKRLPPISQDGPPSDSPSNTVANARSRSDTTVHTRGAVIRKRDLTALSVLVKPPVHFQTMVHRLRVDMSPYHLQWISSGKPPSEEYIAGLLTLDTLPRTAEELPAWEEKLEQARRCDADVAKARKARLAKLAEPRSPSSTYRVSSAQSPAIAQQQQAEDKPPSPAKSSQRPFSNSGTQSLSYTSSSMSSSSELDATGETGAAEKGKTTPEGGVVVYSSQPARSPKSGRERSRGAEGFILSSPRSALCCLRAGVDPRSLLPKPMSHFRQQAEFEGAPSHIPARRYAHFERNRRVLLEQLRATYHDMCSTISLDRFLRLLQRFSPEVNPDQALLDDNLELNQSGERSGCPASTTLSIASLPSERIDTPEDMTPKIDSVVAVFERIDKENTGALPPDVVHEALLADKNVRRQFNISPAADPFQPVFDGISGPTVTLETVIDELQQKDVLTSPMKTKADLAREKSMTTLEESRARLQGHIIRTILMKRKKKRDWEIRQEKMEARLQKYAEERAKTQEERQQQARRRAEMAKAVLEESRHIAEVRRQELVKRQHEASRRQEEVAKQRKYQLEVKRELTMQRIKDKRDGIERQAKINEWDKLCVVDRIRRKHDKAKHSEDSLRDILSETKYLREQMMRQNEVAMKVLHQQL